MSLYIELTCLYTGNSLIIIVLCTGGEPVCTVFVIYSILYFNCVICAVIEFVPSLESWSPLKHIKEPLFMMRWFEGSIQRFDVYMKKDPLQERAF